MSIRIPQRLGRLTLAVTGVAVTTVLALGAGTAQAAPAHHHPDRPAVDKPTVVLVHGAWADSSGWGGVITQLKEDGYPVLAVANPLRGLASDAAYVRSIVDTIDGDVILAGHSYGGGVITNAATGADNVRGLVYIAAFAPDEGETLGQFNDPSLYPGTALTPDSLIFRPYPGGVDATIDPTRFREIFAADLPRRQADIMAVAQRPTNVAVLEEKTVAPAWKTIPSWYQISNQDKALSPRRTAILRRADGRDDHVDQRVARGIHLAPDRDREAHREGRTRDALTSP